MHGKNKTICIAGKNKCAIDSLTYLLKKYPDFKILALPNKSDDGNDTWQKSFKKFARKNKVPITNLKSLYNKKIFIFFH